MMGVWEMVGTHLVAGTETACGQWVSPHAFTTGYDDDIRDLCDACATAVEDPASCDGCDSTERTLHDGLCVDCHED